jgi:hypothetical protein
LLYRLCTKPAPGSYTQKLRFWTPRLPDFHFPLHSGIPATVFFLRYLEKRTTQDRLQEGFEVKGELLYLDMLMKIKKIIR